jgi:hypothetical protein
VVQEMRRLSALRFVVGQVVAAAMGRAAVVMQTAVGGGAYRVVRKAGVEVKWYKARVERRHGPGC